MKKVKVDVPAVQDKAVYFQLREIAAQLNALVAAFGSVLPEYIDDTTAAAGGIAVGGFYRTASIVKQRVA